MDVHQQATLPSALPQQSAEKEQAQHGVDERAISGMQPVQRHAAVPRTSACAPNRAANSGARRGSSRHGLVSASAVMQSAAITVAAGGGLGVSRRRGSISSALAEVATAHS